MNILRYIAGLTGTKTFHAVFWGMHLLHASVERIEQTEAILHDYQLRHIMPGHCTGEDVIKGFSETFGRQYGTCSVGMQVRL